MTDHRAVATALIGIVSDFASSNSETDPAALSVTAQAAIAHALLAVEEQLYTASLIAVYDMKPAAAGGVDGGLLARRIRERTLGVTR